MNFLNRLSKNTQISNFVKIRSVGAELFLADRQTARERERERERDDDANSRFSQFYKRAKKIAQPVVFVSSRGMLGEECGTGIDFSACTLNFCCRK